MIYQVSLFNTKDLQTDLFDTLTGTTTRSQELEQQHKKPFSVIATIPIFGEVLSLYSEYSQWILSTAYKGVLQLSDTNTILNLIILC